MKNTTKKVFILGAGSSISHSNEIFPSINNFFQTAIDMGLNSKYHFIEIGNYVQEHLGLNIQSKSEAINVEDIMTHLEIEIERSTSPTLQTKRQLLLEFIRDILVELQDKLKSPNGEYGKFVSSLQKSDTILTFNWDILLDNALGRKNILSGRKSDEIAAQYANFVNDLSAHRGMTWAHAVFPPYETWPAEKGYYLKLHGSIDWYYCRNQSCRGSNIVYPLLHHKKTHSCSDCHENMELLIIPPVLNKGYRQYPLIRRMWNLAAQELRSADEIIIWGYSMPETDFYSRWLLRQARQGPLKQISIIDPRVIKSSEGTFRRTDFHRRYQNLLRDKIGWNIKLYSSYSDFCDDNDIEKKHKLKPILKRRFTSFQESAP